MPSHSIKQAKVMSAIAHGWHPKGKAAGIPLKVAKEFHAADAGHKYGKGMAEELARGGMPPFPKVPMPFPPMRPFHLAMRPPGMDRRGFTHMEKGGFIDSKIPGRTDKHYVTVHEGSYVLPADHVSALGQNNSNAGAEVVRKMFAPGAQFGPRLTIPKFAGGGAVEPVPIVVAGGEVIIPPSVVKRIGKGDLQRGHEILDKWVLATREKHIKKLESLKPPKGAK